MDSQDSAPFGKYFFVQQVLDGEHQSGCINEICGYTILLVEPIHKIDEGGAGFREATESRVQDGGGSVWREGFDIS
jgi:hypothetical protein